MGTFKSYLYGLYQGLLNYKKQLLIAAVVLFCLSWSLFSPIKGIEQVVASRLIPDQSAMTEKNQTPEAISRPETALANQNYLAAGALASLITPNIPSETNPTDFLSDEETNNLPILQERALLAQASPITPTSQNARGKTVISYLVQEGDTPSSIAASFGITLNTLLWANKLKATSIIRPGDELIILPVSGLIHRVKSGETIGAIAKKYKADSEEIIAFNDLPADGSIQIGQKLIVPYGEMPPPPRPKARRVASRSYAGPGTGKSRAFPYGQCTWYVAQKRYVPWSGHAKDWLTNARAYGFKTGSTPRVGAIISLIGSSWLSRRYGHVGYVEAVNGDWVTFSEMNHLGWAIKSVRTLNVNDPRIKGYIY